MKFNKESVWRNSEAFSSDEIKKISEELIGQAQSKFTSLPTRGNNNPMGMKEFWKRECTFVFGRDANEIVKKVASGKHRFKFM